jgi:hypothetical protein
MFEFRVKGLVRVSYIFQYSKFSILIKFTKNTKTSSAVLAKHVGRIIFISLINKVHNYICKKYCFRPSYRILSPSDVCQVIVFK